MIVYVKWQTGGDVGTVDIEGMDTLETVREKVAAVSGVRRSAEQVEQILGLRRSFDLLDLLV